MASVTRAASPLLVLMIVQALLGSFCLTIGHGERSWAALRFWGIGLLIHAAGVLTALVIASPVTAGTLVGNALIATAPVFYMAAALTHSRVRFRQRWLITAGVVSIAPVVAAYFVPTPFLGAGVLAPTPVAVALFTVGAWALGETRLRSAPGAAGL